MKTTALTMVAWLMMAVACYGQASDEELIGNTMDFSDRVKRQEQELAKEQAAKKVEHDRAVAVGRSLFGADKRWMEDRSISDSWSTGTVFGKSPLAYTVGDWGYTELEFRVIGRAGKDCLVLPNVPGAQVMLLRGLDMSKVTDGVTFVLQHPFVIPETYSYRTVTGGQKTVLVMEVNEEKLAVELAKVGADIETQKAAKMAAEKAKQDAEKAAQDAVAAAKQRIEDAKRRTWTSADGRFTVDAKFLAFVNGVVTLEKDDGKTISVNLNVLSQEDQDFIVYRKWVPRKSTYPTPETATPAPANGPPPASTTASKGPPLAVGPFDGTTAKEHQAAWAEYLKTPVVQINSIGMKLVLIPAGEFQMGAADGESGANPDEKPQHRVRITKPFYLGVCEVTQAEYVRVMGRNPSNFKGKDGLLPVESVSWEEAQDFCRKLSGLPDEQRASAVYRLPTEAEWEYACRAGTETAYGLVEHADKLREFAWCGEDSASQTNPVGQKKPNAWGLYDVHGNVWEWCADWYGNYLASAVEDPTGPITGSERVHRGGAWHSSAEFCRSAKRSDAPLDFRNDGLGFRVARSMTAK
jgi:formylglycine-generating enzyme required for sulfatase activity